MPDTNLSDDLVKLVEYSIVSIEPGEERILPGAAGRRILLRDNTTGKDFAGWMVRRYLERHPDENLGDGNRYLRVPFRVLGRWPRESLGFKRKQLRRLDEIKHAQLAQLEAMERPLLPAGEAAAAAETPAAAKTDAKSAVRKSSVRKPTAKNSTARKPAARRAAGRKPEAKKPAAKTPASARSPLRKPVRRS